MAPPRIPERDRKRAYAVSLTPRQRAKMVALGGSPWLQDTLDATPLPADHARMLRICQEMTGRDAHRSRK